MVLNPQENSIPLAGDVSYKSQNLPSSLLDLSPRTLEISYPFPLRCVIYSEGTLSQGS